MTIQDCAAWAAALGTIFATVLTALNLRREAQWRREDEKQRNDNEKQEQAARITAWILTKKSRDKRRKTSYTSVINPSLPYIVVLQSSSSTNETGAILQRVIEESSLHFLQENGSLLPPRGGKECVLALA